MTWDPLGLETWGDDWVAAPEVVVSGWGIRGESHFTSIFYSKQQQHSIRSL